MSPELKAHYTSKLTTLATCWKATLTNGRVVAATGFDQNILFDGAYFLSTAGYIGSDIQSSAELNPDNLEVDGFLRSPAITEEDIHSGLWDYAAIEIFEVNYEDLTMGKNVLRAGTLGEVKGGRHKFTAELRGLMQAYSRTIVRLMTQDCNADLGDARCKVDLSAWTVTGTVTSVSDNRVIGDTSRHEDINWFTGGKLTFTSGLNAGLSMEVKSFISTIDLQERMPFQIVEGDTYSMYAGCSRRALLDCRIKFDNYINFRGFPDLPQSKIYRRGSEGVGTGTTP
jgi:uncharacterized phage protein (TIGR02218 family)